MWVELRSPELLGLTATLAPTLPPDGGLTFAFPLCGGLLVKATLAEL